MAHTNGTTIAWTTVQCIPLGLYCITATLLGIFGNSIVVYSSIRYNAIKLDKVSQILVQNLAIAGILYTLSKILPTTITYMAGRYILGEVYCFVSAQLTAIPSVVITITMFSISSYHLLLLTSPSFNITTTGVYMAVALIWVLASFSTVLSLSYQSRSTFSPTIVSCISSIYEKEEAALCLLAAVALLVILPLLATTLFNMVLFVVAYKQLRVSGSGAMLLSCSLAVLFVVSWIPYVVFAVMKGRKEEVPPFLELLAFHCIFISSFGNPVLYALTMKRFGEYLKIVWGGCFCGGTGDNQQLSSVNSGGGLTTHGI